MRTTGIVRDINPTEVAETIEDLPDAVSEEEAEGAIDAAGMVTGCLVRIRHRDVVGRYVVGKVPGVLASQMVIYGDQMEDLAKQMVADGCNNQLKPEERANAVMAHAAVVKNHCLLAGIGLRLGEIYGAANKRIRRQSVGPQVYIEQMNVGQGDQARPVESQPIDAETGS